MKKVLVVFHATEPTTIDQDFSEELKHEDWETERDVIRALKKLGYDYQLLGIFNNTDIIAEKVRSYQPDVIFNLVERFNGDTSLDRDVASYFTLLGIPYTGCGPTGLTLCKNKALSKKILSYHHIHVPNFAILHRGKKIKRPASLKFPIIIKPLKEEASMGISQASFVEDDEQFKKRVSFIHESMEQDAIAEEFIHGRELYVSLLGTKRIQVFPIRELVFREVPDDEPKFASYKVKWDAAYRKKWGIRYQFAGSLARGMEEKIIKTCKKIYKLLLINGYARIDIRVTPEGQIYFIEANPNPILSNWEDFGWSADKAEVSYPELIKKIIDLAVI